MAPSTFSVRENTRSVYRQERGTDSRNVSPPMYFHDECSFCKHKVNGRGGGGKVINSMMMMMIELN